jgi:hypothetical protein
MIGMHRLAHYLSTGELPEHVMHLCDNPPCCNPGHLMSGDAGRNAKDMAKKGRSASGSRHAMSKLTEAQVKDIKSRPRNHGHLAALSEEFGVSASTISLIMLGKTWKNVG